MTSRPRRNPLRDLPLPALYFVIAGLWVVIQLVVHQGAITWTTVITTVLGGLVFSGVLTTVMAGNRRRLGGVGQVSAFSRALRTGTPPVDADVERWRRELDRLDRTRTRRTLLSVATTVIPIGFGIWGLTDPDARSVATLLILLFVALDIAALAMLPVRRRRSARLRHNLPVSASS